MFPVVPQLALPLEVFFRLNLVLRHLHKQVSDAQILASEADTHDMQD